MPFKIQTLRNAEQGCIFHFWDQIKYSFKWFCKTTTLHGFRFITSKDSSLFTQILFALACCCTLILCGYLIVLEVFEHQYNSVLTTVRSTAYPVWKIPFPSVTICNYNVVYKYHLKQVFNEIKIHGIDKQLFKKFVRNLSTLITHDNLEGMNNYQEILIALDRAGYTTDKLMKELAHPCENMITKCFWQSEEVKCSEIFQSIKTSNGYCCSFNYYGINTNNNNQRWYYQYAGGAGPALGLRVLLDIEEDMYISPIRSLYGFKVSVQDGADYPDMDLLANSLLSAEELSISVTPRIYDSSENVRSMSVQRRNCLFEDEDDLKLSYIYSFATCISQCRAKTILQLCNCIPYYYYPVEKNNRFCTLLDEPCLQANKYSYSVLGVTDSYLTDMTPSSNDQVNQQIQCNCYPQCSEKIFDFQTDTSKAIPMEGFEYTNMSILNVFYNTVGCIEINRDLYYTWDHVFASLGGIFGLCLGGSLISILECFFFMGKCILPKWKKLKAVKHKVPEIYVSDFAHHYYDKSYEGEHS